MVVLEGGAVSYEQGTLSTLGSYNGASRTKKQPSPRATFNPGHMPTDGTYSGTSLIRNTPPPPGTPQGPGHVPSVGFTGGAVSCERGTPVALSGATGVSRP